jgi:hypothetical protein
MMLDGITTVTMSNADDSMVITSLDVEKQVYAATAYDFELTATQWRASKDSQEIH